MKLLVITPYYLPDGGPSAPMISMLAEELVGRGHAVTVLAAVPHFPSGHVEPEYRRQPWQWSDQQGVRVCRVRVPSGDRGDLRHRAWVFLVYQLLVTLAGLRLDYDAALVTNPAIETGLPFAVLCWLRRKPCVYATWDVYPEVGIRAGVFHNGSQIRMVRLLEDFCLHRAQFTQVLSEGFRAELASRPLTQEQIVVIPPWLETDLICPQPRRNSFSHAFDLDDRLVVLYAGNLGASQGLESVVDAARSLSYKPQISFLFVGDGIGKSALVERAADLSNVRFIPFQPRERLSEVLASADIGLVVLKRGIGVASLPSKLFSILAAGRPVIVSVDEDSDAWNLVRKAEAGLCVRPEEPLPLADAILELIDDPAQRERMGENGRLWAEEHHSARSAALHFEQLFRSLLDGRSC